MFWKRPFWTVLQRITVSGGSWKDKIELVQDVFIGYIKVQQFTGTVEHYCICERCSRGSCVWNLINVLKGCHLSQCCFENYKMHEHEWLSLTETPCTSLEIIVMASQTLFMCFFFNSPLQLWVHYFHIMGGSVTLLVSLAERGIMLEEWFDSFLCTFSYSLCCETGLSSTPPFKPANIKSSKDRFSGE